MKSVRLGLILAGLVFSASAFLEARDIIREEKEIPALLGITQVRLNGHIDAAELIITVGDHEAIMKGSFRYDADRGQVEVQYSQDGEFLDLDLFQESAQWRYRLDSKDTRLELSLSSRYSWGIELTAGATECRFDLTGLPLERLSLDFTAVDGQIRFTGTNPRLLKDFQIDVSAGELKMIGLGYANFSHLVIDCGAGDLDVDFSGLADGRHRARIDIGAGEIRIDTPEDYPVRIHADDGWLNSIEVGKRHLLKVDDDTYESGNFEGKGRGLIIDLDIGIGEAVLSREVVIEKEGPARTTSFDRPEFLTLLPPMPILPPQPPLPAALPPLLIENVGNGDILPLPPVPPLPDSPPLPGIIVPGWEDDYGSAE